MAQKYNYQSVPVKTSGVRTVKTSYVSSSRSAFPESEPLATQNQVYQTGSVAQA